MLLYWPHTSALVAYDGGTSIGHGPVRTLFLELDLVCSAGKLDVGHGPVTTLFLSLILCLVPMTPSESMLYWPHTSALVAYDGGTSVGHGPVKTLFLEPDFVPSAGTVDVGHGPVTTLFLGLILCLVTPCETMLYWPESQLIGGHAEYYVLCGLGVPSLRSLWGSCTYCACIAKVAFLSIFQFFNFFLNLHDLLQKKFKFFLIIHTTYRKKKYTTRRFFCTRLTFFTVCVLRCECTLTPSGMRNNCGALILSLDHVTGRRGGSPWRRGGSMEAYLGVYMGHT